MAPRKVQGCRPRRLLIQMHCLSGYAQEVGSKISQGVRCLLSHRRPLLHVVDMLSRLV